MKTRIYARSLFVVAALTVAMTALLLRAVAQEGHDLMNPDGTPNYTNRLIDATSPYLLQHAHNPVDWNEWGDEAIERARRENKPIFLSIGYSSCHWCHVMAHESFENEAIAKIMNEHFVCIKVDREERPDIDEIYMQATLIMNKGQGGWPMSVWLTPELKPFFAGTYFPPESRYGRPGFGELCERIAEAWSTKRDAIETDAARLTEFVDQSMRGVGGVGGAGEGTAAIDLAFIDAAADGLAGRFDDQRGGISGGGPNKFPPSVTLELFLRAIDRRGPDGANVEELRHLVDLTLDEMSRGGIYDQLAGGIHRYSTDPEWLVPHFEKMLYDQALVSRIYVDAWQATGNAEYRRVASDIFDYVLADLQSEQGGFYSTRDADSEGVEGKCYVWTREEVLTVLGAEEGALFCKFYDVSAAGNWNDQHDPGTTKNVLHVPHDLATFAKAEKLEPAEVERRLAASREKLLAARATRTAPSRDDKILVEWNGLMIAALARGGALFDEPKYSQAAARAADFLLEHQYADGRLLRAFRDGRKLETAFLTDYACLTFGLLELYEATFDRRWFDAAVKLNDATIEHFWDSSDGGFFFTPDDGEKLITRARDVRDGATPGGNSIQLMNLLRLAAMRDDARLRQLAEKSIAALGPQARQSVGAAECFLAGVEFALEGPVEIAIVGDPADKRTQALLREVRNTYLPNHVVMLLDPAHRDRSPPSPLLTARPLVDGQPAAYVCRNYACQRPVTTPEELRAQLRAE